MLANMTKKENSVFRSDQCGRENDTHVTTREGFLAN